jgi:hypothetical protein
MILPYSAWASKKAGGSQVAHNMNVVSSDPDKKSARNKLLHSESNHSAASVLPVIFQDETFRLFNFLVKNLPNAERHLILYARLFSSFDRIVFVARFI